MISGPDTSNPARLGAREACDAIRAGKLTASALLEACIDRISERDKAVQAWAFFDPALPRSAPPAEGPLSGLPVGVKDIIETADMPTACGSPIHDGRYTGRDAACVAALRAAGGVVMGKTTTTEFAAYTPTATRNPHDQGHTPGGSSSGSAAAVADFQVPLAIGTQTAGSVLRPAAFCGVVGYKPSFGTIEMTGTQPFASSLDTLGVFTRSASDAGFFAAALSGWNTLAEAASSPPTKVRLITAPAWQRATEEARANLAVVADSIREAGVPVDDTPLQDDLVEELSAILEVQEFIQLCEGRRALTWEYSQHADSLSPGLRAQLDSVAKSPFEVLLNARRQQAQAQEKIAARMAEGEVWLTLPAPGEAPEGTATGDPVFCRVWTALHLPAISLPHGLGPNGLPLGIQMIGRYASDPSLLAAAIWLEGLLHASGRRSE